jgi:hypothetical protein
MRSSITVVHRKAGMLHLPVSRITNLQEKEMLLNNSDILLTNFMEKYFGRENPDVK